MDSCFAMGKQWGDCILNPQSPGAFFHTSFRNDLLAISQQKRVQVGISIYDRNAPCTQGENNFVNPGPKGYGGSNYCFHIRRYIVAAMGKLNDFVQATITPIRKKLVLDRGPL